MKQAGMVREYKPDLGIALDAVAEEFEDVGLPAGRVGDDQSIPRTRWSGLLRRSRPHRRGGRAR
jgi:hypothetical protein